MVRLLSDTEVAAASQSRSSAHLRSWNANSSVSSPKYRENLNLVYGPDLQCFIYIHNIAGVLQVQMFSFLNSLTELDQLYTHIEGDNTTGKTSVFWCANDNCLAS